MGPMAKAEVHDQTIQDVSQTLLDLLTMNLSGDQIKIGLMSPKEDPGQNHLTLFLYKVLENAYLKNAENQIAKTDDHGRLIQSRAPLTLDLYYLLTARSAAGGILAAHRALSRAMRVFYDNGVLHGSLVHTLDPKHGLTSESVLRITLNPLTMEDMTRIWSVFPDTPYEISVAYLVTPVAIESTLEDTSAPVVDQFHEHGQRGAELAGART